MNPPATDDGDPFQDPSTSPPNLPTQLTLAVGRNAFLNLGSESLVVLDEGFVDKEPVRCCGLLQPKTTRAIPFHNILWAELADWEIAISYAHPTSKDAVRVAHINYIVEKTDRQDAEAWIERLLERAYGQSQRRKRIKVLVNPFGGKGSAQKWFTRDIEPIFAAARSELSVEKTKYSGHATEIAEQLDIDAWDVVACCSGDGVAYEVINGFGKRPDAARALRKVAVVQLPCGTGNAMCLNLTGTDSTSLSALSVTKGIRMPLDLVSITQGDRRTLSFLSQAVGIIAEVDLGTENLRWMGSARFTYGFIVRLLGQTIYPADIAIGVEVEDKAAVKEAYKRQHADPTPYTPPEVTDESAGLPKLKYGTVNDELPTDWKMIPHDKLGNFYCGNMAFMAPDTNFFAAALPSDGCMDLVTIDGDIPRLTALKLLMAVGSGNQESLFDMSCVNYRKVSGFRIVPKQKGGGYISIDGEKMPFEPFQAEVHRALGTVLSKTGRVYEADGVA
ncbi:sphingosine kinase [Aulographum hederae CBS 113979]|uniref:Sphingosine kinase n=1 Tax=Aulographum hederae CBS 113979 TaxID=1176131 RepID=A0A6G1GKD9_9PEZI|nr:sphingosine kinase [Aulographum hederae CBS 113979]